MGVLNDFLLIPMFIIIVQSIENVHNSFTELSWEWQNLLLNALFFAEWILGLILTENKKNIV